MTHPYPRKALAFLLTLGIAAALGSCTYRELATAPNTASGAQDLTRALHKDIDVIVVIYAENRAFDNLYGNFPGRAEFARRDRCERPPVAGLSPAS